jgi:hypothetical protein
MTLPDSSVIPNTVLKPTPGHRSIARRSTSAGIGAAP